MVGAFFIKKIAKQRPSIMNALEDLRQTAAKYLNYLLWLHVPLLAIAGYFVGGDWVSATIGGAVFAAIPTLLKFQQGVNFTYRSSVAISFVVQVGLLVYVFSGHPWQIDIHMYFFAALAIVSAFCCWRSILVATVAIALHHLILNFVLPAAVFPEGADFFRVVLHAVIVVLEAAVLVFMTAKLTGAFEASQSAVDMAEKAHQETLAEKALAEQATQDAKKAAAEAVRLKEEAERLQDEKTRADDVQRQERTRQRNEIASSFEESVGGILRKVSDNSKNLSGLADNLQQISVNVENRISHTTDLAGDMTNNVQTVTAATEELSKSIQEISSQVNQSNQVVSNAADRATATASTMAELKDAAQQISEVVSLINDIAEQTNLLALNATIEAARAGDAGKGFAVVASEVKNLATQTARATEEISSQISGIQSVSEQAGSEIEAILKIIEDINSTTAS
ncbi:MAG: hypothetical protein JJ879_14505, partial [Sneathiella sp.]|nr:hypothetical protein [Sneathiella sp.]